MAWTTPRTWVGGEIPTSAIFNTHIRDNVAWLYSGDASWNNVAGGVGFQNSWTDYGAPWTPTRYRRVGDFVTIQGLVKNGVFGDNIPIFTLPVGYRPGRNLIWATKDNQGSTGYSELRVNTNGNVVAEVGANGYFSVNCVFVQEG